MESDCESNTSIIEPPFNLTVHKNPLTSAPPLPAYEENYFRPDYGVNNVILAGKWNVYPYLEQEESCSITTPSVCETYVIIEDNSLILEGSKKKTEKDPLIRTVQLCKSCKKHYTSKQRHNYFVIILLIFITFSSIYSLFPWGFFGIICLFFIPKFMNVPTCKKCRRKWC